MRIMRQEDYVWEGMQIRMKLDQTVSTYLQESPKNEIPIQFCIKNYYIMYNYCCIIIILYYNYIII